MVCPSGLVLGGICPDTGISTQWILLDDRRRRRKSVHGGNVGPTGYVDLVFLLSRSHHRHRQQEQEQPAAHCVLLRQAAVVGTIVFGTAEQFLPFLWTPTEHVVHRAGWGSEGIAMYVLPAETLLGPMILYFYHVTKDGTNWYQPVIGAGMTMLMYTGALSIGLLALEVGPRNSITT